MGVEQIPPHNEQGERIILASALHIEEVREHVCTVLTEDHFYSRYMRKLFAIVCKINRKGYEPNIALIGQEFEPSLLAEVYTSATMPLGDLKNIIANIKTRKIERETLLSAQKIISIITSDVESSERADSALEVIQSIKEAIEPKSGLKHVSECVMSAVSEFKDIADGKSKGVKTGLTKIDAMTGGFFKGENHIIAGRPAQGKTSAALTIMKNMALDGKSVGFYSIEMPVAKVINRMITMLSKGGVNGDHLRGTIPVSRKAMESYQDGAEKINGLPLYFDDSPRTSISGIEGGLRSFVRKNKLDAVFVDYISRVNYDGGDKSKPRHEKVGEISVRLAELYKELDIAGVTLVQLKRESQNSKPVLSDLRESGQIEQDANYVYMIYRPDVNNKEKCMIVCNKSRDVGEGDYPMNFNACTTEFTSMSRDEEAEFYSMSNRQSEPNFG